MGQSALDSSSPKRVDVSCPTGKKAIGGGVTFVPRPLPSAIATTINSPDIGQTIWIGEAEETTATASNWQLFVRVVCANVAS